jgi:hypothetical protein
LLLAGLAAGLALAVGTLVDEMNYRVRLYRGRADEFAKLEEDSKQYAKVVADDIRDPKQAYHRTSLIEVQRYQDALAAYYATLKDKYRRAARRPWQAVPPDPPGP